MDIREQVRGLLEKAKQERRNRNPAGEAQCLEQAGDLLRDKRMLNRAAQLYVDAAKNYRHAAKVEEGINAGEKAIRCYAQAGRRDEALRLYRAIIQVLEADGHKDKAELLRRKAEKVAGEMGLRHKIFEHEEREKPQLPTTCPNCSAALKPQEIKRLGMGLVECPYCGGSIKAG